MINRQGNLQIQYYSTYAIFLPGQPDYDYLAWNKTFVCFFILVSKGTWCGRKSMIQCMLLCREIITADPFTDIKKEPPKGVLSEQQLLKPLLL